MPVGKVIHIEALAQCQRGATTDVANRHRRSTRPSIPGGSWPNADGWRALSLVANAPQSSKFLARLVRTIDLLATLQDHSVAPQDSSVTRRVESHDGSRRVRER